MTAGAALFTDAWIDECNAALSGLPAPADGRTLVVAELVRDAPPGAHDAITLVADNDGIRLLAGEDPAATARLSIAMADAMALHAGQLEPAAALAEGRVRVRGDLRAVVDAVGLLTDAYARLASRDDR